jgi:glycosyltransferase involved in cell wall biosynthesis
MTTVNPLVSVVIPTHNRGADLQRGVEAVLAACAGVVTEVIYVDDSSTDETAQILARYALDGRIRHETVCARAHGPARNAGAAVARGDFLLFTDDDCMVPERWVADMVAARASHQVPALSGGFRPASMETSAERYYAYRMATIFGDRAKPVTAVPMMNLLVERAAYETVGGFSALRLPSMEDWEFCYRLTLAGHGLYYDPVVSVVHPYGRHWRYVRKRVFQAAWLGPAVWRLTGLNVRRKLARDILRWASSPLWCLAYFPLRLYLPAVLLEMAYFVIRLAGAIAARRVERRFRVP